MLKVLVLVSGAGSNLRAFLDVAQAEDYPATVIAVGADRPATGLEHARERGIPTFVVPFADFGSREAWGQALLATVQSWQPDLVLLSGFMRLLPEAVVDALSPNILNTHPAYLPEFPGAHGVRDALAAGVRESGASLIVVDSGVDTGPIVAQERCPVHPNDTEQTLHNRIKVIERELIVRCVRQIAENTINLRELKPA